VVSLTAGTMFLMWLGEQITERGLGNGISILIFAGIAAGLPGAIGGLLELVRTGAMSIIVACSSSRGVPGDLFRGVRRARPAQDPGELRARQVGNKVYGGQSSHLPLKLNMAGVIPPIFASSIILLPATVVGWFSTGDSMRGSRTSPPRCRRASRSTCCCTRRRSSSSASSTRRWCSTAARPPTT
jgi:preprotein translocase subunit SecY